MSGTLSRRTLLRGLWRGAVVGVALPPLEAMLAASGAALADGSALPSRFGVWSWGNGVKLDRWLPEGVGGGSVFSEELAPLEPVRAWVSVISGCEVRTGSHAHHAGKAGVLSGREYLNVGDVDGSIASTFAGPSVDQLAADALEGQAPLRSLELGVCRFRGSVEGSTFEHLSHNGPNSFNPSEYSPSRLYERLFGLPASAELDLARQSVLDLVGDQTRALQRGLGSADRLRLEQHLDSIRALEHQIATLPQGCGLVGGLEDVADVGGVEQISAKNTVMSELLALILQCDLTRVFSVQFSTCGSTVVMGEIGITESLHALSHAEAEPQPSLHAATVFTMEQLAHLLGRLAEAEEGDGSVLERCSILCTSEVSDGRTHSVQDIPLLLAGGGDGRLRGDLHLATDGANASRGPLTALYGVGIEVDSFGADEGYVDEPFSELLV